MRTAVAEADDPKAAGEKALAAAAKELAAELRLTDVVDLVTFIRTENHPNLSDLVSSSAELSFKPGTIAYGWAADVRLAWSGSPTVRLDLEFRHKDVTAFFDLILEPQRAGVELKHIAGEAGAAAPAERSRRLIEAIADARLP
jgi:hypothetical protein